MSKEIKLTREQYEKLEQFDSQFIKIAESEKVLNFSTKKKKIAVKIYNEIVGDLKAQSCNGCSTNWILRLAIWYSKYKKENDL